jgi:hypothetical protein
MAPALRMTRSIKEKLPIFLDVFCPPPLFEVLIIIVLQLLSFWGGGGYFLLCGLPVA